MGYNQMIRGVICLQSEQNKKYLRYLPGDVQTHGLVQFSADKPIDLSAQFEVVPACCDTNLVHFKSRYTNKFLVRWAPNQYYITASADAPNENKTSWACTLFKPITIQTYPATKIRLMHVQLGRYASCYWKVVQPFTSCLYAGSKDVDCDACDIFTALDWPSVFKLPRHVAFKGDNDKYLGISTFEGYPCLQFSFDNPYHAMVAHEVFPNRDGTVCIKSNYTGKFWRRLDHNDHWIAADVDQSEINGNVAAMFRPNVLDLNNFALLNMSNLQYIKRLHRGNGYNMLSAFTPSVDPFSPLRVKDLGQ